MTAVVPQSRVMNLAPPSTSVGSYRRAAMSAAGPTPRPSTPVHNAEGTFSSSEDESRSPSHVAAADGVDMVARARRCWAIAKSIFVFVVGSPGRSSLI